VVSSNLRVALHVDWRRTARHRALQVCPLNSCSSSHQLTAITPRYYGSDLSDEERFQLSEVTDETPLKSPNSQAQIYGTGVDETNKISSPDTTLTALCQLAAIRLGVQRVGISLIARQAQYILAESTQTLNLQDTTKCDRPGDELWMGLTEVSPARVLFPRMLKEAKVQSSWQSLRKHCPIKPRARC
jgi:hypothetical protein